MERARPGRSGALEHVDDIAVIDIGWQRGHRQDRDVIPHPETARRRGRLGAAQQRSLQQLLMYLRGFERSDLQPAVARQSKRGVEHSLRVGTAGAHRRPQQPGSERDAVATRRARRPDHVLGQAKAGGRHLPGELALQLEERSPDAPAIDALLPEALRLAAVEVRGRGDHLRRTLHADQPAHEGFAEPSMGDRPDRDRRSLHARNRAPAHALDVEQPIGRFGHAWHEQATCERAAQMQRWAQITGGDTLLEKANRAARRLIPVHLSSGAPGRASERPST